MQMQKCLLLFTIQVNGVIKLTKYLIIARVGDNSLHHHWINSKNKNFDIFISYFGNEDNKYANNADYYEHVKGGKWPVIAALVDKNWEIISKYDAVWLPDDDLLVDTNSICKMFDLFTAFNLSLGQPALSIDSYFSHPCLLQKKNSIIRFTNFVEVMAPIFSLTSLERIKHTFSQSKSGWGLDFLWPHLVDGKIGIIDSTPVTHTRPIGGELYRLNPELSPKMDIITLQETYPNISLNKKKNRFKVYSQIIETTRLNEKCASIKGKLQTYLSKIKSKKQVKYSN